MIGSCRPSDPSTSAFLFPFYHMTKSVRRRLTPVFCSLSLAAEPCFQSMCLFSVLATLSPLVTWSDKLLLDRAPAAAGESARLLRSAHCYLAPPLFRMTCFFFSLVQCFIGRPSRQPTRGISLFSPSLVCPCVPFFSWHESELMEKYPPSLIFSFFMVFLLHFRPFPPYVYRQTSCCGRDQGELSWLVPRPPLLSGRITEEESAPQLFWDIFLSLPKKVRPSLRGSPTAVIVGVHRGRSCLSPLDVQEIHEKETTLFR